MNYGLPILFVFAFTASCNGSFLTVVKSQKDNLRTGSCGQTVVPSDSCTQLDAPISTKTKSHYSGLYGTVGSASFLLAPSGLVRLKLRANISCSDAQYYGFSIESGATEPSQWLDCDETDEFTTFAELEFGTNFVKIWFKANTISGEKIKSSDEIYYYAAEELALHDPNSTVGGLFSEDDVVILSNGNIAVGKKNDSTTLSAAGAVHIFSGLKGDLVGSIYGDQASNELSSGSMVATHNGNLIIISHEDDTATLTDNGSVILVDGENGDEMGRVEGGYDGDELGSAGIELFGDSKYYIKSPQANTAGFTGVGSVVIADVTTGMETARFEGEDDGDSFGLRVQAGADGKLLITSGSDDTGATTNHGSAVLFDTNINAEINRISGVQTDDYLGLFGTAKLTNGNFVSSSGWYHCGAIAYCGAAILFDGDDGTVISTAYGDSDGDSFGFSIFPLSNGNYIVLSTWDDTGGLTNNGSVALFNGANGVEIGRIEGDFDEDQLGYYAGILELSNGNYIVGSPNDNTASEALSGSIILVDGMTGLELNRIEGDDANDKIGYERAKILPNGNLVFANRYDTTNGNSKSGSVIVTDKDLNILKRFEGQYVNDYMGWMSIVILTNGNFVIPVQDHDTVDHVDAGVVIFVNGETNDEIARFSGDLASDRISSSGIFELISGDFVIASSKDSSGAVSSHGSVTLVDGKTGLELGKLSGDSAGQQISYSGIIPLRTGDFAILNRNDSTGSFTSNGSVIIADGRNAKVIKKVNGSADGSTLGGNGYLVHPTNYLIFLEPKATVGGDFWAGQLRLITY